MQFQFKAADFKFCCNVSLYCYGYSVEVVYALTAKCPRWYKIQNIFYQKTQHNKNDRTILWSK